MFELILIVSLLKEPQRCEEIYLRSGPVGSMAQCLVNGPLQAVKWAETHEGWTIKRWTYGLPQA